MTPPPPRFVVTRDDIRRVVKRFYQEVRDDAVLAPIFAQHVTDWDAHERKITAFWANAILYERSYDGNPMQVHKAAGSVRPEHFAHWLEMFDEVLLKELPESTAAGWSLLAHRIGRGLRLGLAYDPISSRPPSLRA